MVEEIRRVMGDGAAHGVRLRYAVETEPLGTAGGIRNAVDLVGGLVVVLNGDILADVDLSAIWLLSRDEPTMVEWALTALLYYVGLAVQVFALSLTYKEVVAFGDQVTSS
jgi:NDP-sugar pyrophosphorylase family protein